MTQAFARQLPKFIRALAATSLAAVSIAAHAASIVEVYKSPYCGCCGKWVEHMEQAGFKVKVTEITDVAAQRQRLKMPDTVVSCHTATVAGYALEGHIPATDVKRLLKDKPKARGIAVPGMPAGSPGMDAAKRVAFNTLLVNLDGSTSVFAKH